MLITPLVAGIGGLIAFFTVVAIVVWLPIHTFDPPPSGDWAPLSSPGGQRPQPVRLERLLRLPLGLLAAAGRALRELLPLPEGLAAGRLLRAATSRRTFSAPSAPALTSRRSRGWHPDDWQRAHFYDPRYMDPLSLMPSMKSLFSDKQVDQLVTFVETRSGKSGLLRYAGQLYAKHIVLVEPGLPRAVHGLPGRAQADRSSRTKTGSSRRRASSRRRRTSPRSTAATGSPRNPLPVTEHNLYRGKEVFLDRCVGCHGMKGDGKGPGASFLSPHSGRLHRQGRRLLWRRHRARRLLLPHPARLAGHGDGELRRPPVRRRHLARRPVHQDDPERDARPERRPGAERLHRLAALGRAPGLAETPAEARRRTSSFTKRRRRDPFMQEAMRVFPGLAPGDSFLVNDGITRAFAPGRGGRHQDDLHQLLDQAWSDAAARGEKLPPSRRKRSHRPCRGSSEARLLVLAAPFCSRSRFRPRRSRTTPPRSDQSRWVMADWMMDTFFIFSGLALVVFLTAWKLGHFHDLDEAARSRSTSRRRTTTRPSGRWTRRSGDDGHADRRLAADGGAVLPLPAGTPPDRPAGRDLARRTGSRSPGCGGSSSSLVLGILLLGLAVPDDPAAQRGRERCIRSTASAATRPSRPARPRSSSSCSRSS